MSTAPRRARRLAWAATIVGVATLVIGLGVHFRAARSLDGRWVSGVTIFALVVGFSSGWLLGRRPRQLPSAGLVRAFLVDYHQVRHETFGPHRPFARLRLWAQMATAGLAEGTRDLESACGEFLGIGLPALRRFATQAEELAVTPARVRAIRDEVDRIERRLREALVVAGPARNECVDEAVRHIEVLSEACRSAYDEIAARAPCRPDRVIEEVLRAKAGAPGLRHARVAFEAEDDARVPVLFDPGALGALIGELLENAGRALRNTHAPMVKVRVAPHPSDPRFVIVTIQDNGPGIGESMRPVVFQPGSSSRAVGGFGLAHARDTARAWLGDLQLEDGGGGSVAVLRLRVLAAEAGSAGVMA